MELRIAVGDDCGLIISLIRSQYGELYPVKDFYRDACVRGVIEDGSYRFALAVENGVPAACLACSENQGRLFFSHMITNADFRGMGLAGGLYDFLVGTVGFDGYTCAYGAACLLISSSQRLMLRRGYVPVGLFLCGRYLDASVAEYEALPKGFKDGNLAVCKPLAKRDAGMLYLPEALRGAVARVYDSLGVTYSFGEPAEPSPEAGSTQAHIRQNSMHDECRVVINKTGCDLDALIRNLAEKYSGGDNQTFTVRLNMADRHAAWGIDRLLEAGFIYAGTEPLAKSAEYMILFNPGRHRIDFGRIQLIPEAEYLFEDVRRIILKGEEDFDE